MEGIRELGLQCLHWSTKAKRLRARLAISGLKDTSDAALLETLEIWAGPFLGAITDAEGLRRFDPTEALRAAIDWDDWKQLEQSVPAHYRTPLGRSVEIDYGTGMRGYALL